MLEVFTEEVEALVKVGIANLPRPSIGVYLKTRKRALLP
jgi:hypothetical protein